MVRLVHYIGRNRTLDLLMLGRDIDAGRALELGLVSMVVADDAFERETAAVMQRLASGALLPFQAIKEAVRAQARDGLDRSYPPRGGMVATHPSLRATRTRG